MRLSRDIISDVFEGEGVPDVQIKSAYTVANDITRWTVITAEGAAVSFVSGGLDELLSDEIAETVITNRARDAAASIKMLIETSPTN